MSDQKDNKAGVEEQEVYNSEEVLKKIESGRRITETEATEALEKFNKQRSEKIQQEFLKEVLKVEYFIGKQVLIVRKERGQAKASVARLKSISEKRDLLSTGKLSLEDFREAYDKAQRAYNEELRNIGNTYDKAVRQLREYYGEYFERNWDWGFNGDW